MNGTSGRKVDKQIDRLAAHSNEIAGGWFLLARCLLLVAERNADGLIEDIFESLLRKC